MMGHIISHYSSKSLLVLAMFLLNHLGVRDGGTLARSHPYYFYLRRQVTIFLHPNVYNRIGINIHFRGMV